MHHKPLPVFNKAKFQETVAAARAQSKPRIQASITARSLSREMREQLRITKPQMGAFRSNIMTAENGDYDPEKALKAKTLFIAESALENGLKDSQKHAGDDTTPSAPTAAVASHGHPARAAVSAVAADTHRDDDSTAVDEGLEQSDDAGDDVKSVGLPENDEGKRENGGGPPIGDSGHYDADSLDEESELEPQYAEIVKKDDGKVPAAEQMAKSRSGSVGSGRSGSVGSGRSGSVHSARLEEKDEKDSHSIGGDSTDSGAGLSSSKRSPQPTTAAEEEGDNIPLSQAPNWDLLI